MDDAHHQYWYRRPGSDQVHGPYDENDLVALAQSDVLTSAHEIARSASGPWDTRSPLPMLNTIFDQRRAARRRASAVIPHLSGVTALAVLAFAWPRLEPAVVTMVRLLVAVCAFTIGFAYEDVVDRAPRWLFVLSSLVFLFPSGFKVGDAAGLGMISLTALAMLIHGNAILQRIEEQSLSVRAAGKLLNLGVWVLVIIMLGATGLLDSRWGAWLQ